MTNGSYTITPSDDLYTFNPISRNITISGNNIANQNFTATSILCDQYFEVRDENSNLIAGVEVFDGDAFSEISKEGGPVCYTDDTGRCFLSFRRTEKNHTTEASKDGYECYNNECKKTFDGCLNAPIILKLKIAATYQTADLNCDGKVNMPDFAILLDYWGRNPAGIDTCPSSEVRSPDIDGNGDIGSTDFAEMMDQWT